MGQQELLEERRGEETGRQAAASTVVYGAC